MPNKSDSNTLNIGLLISSLFNTYESNIYAGIKKFASENNINLLCFPGCVINSPYYKCSQKKNVVYELVGNENIDGLIGISGTLGTHLTKEKLIDFYNAYMPIPTVSIGISLENIPSIVVDNEKGIRELLIHLIIDHGFKHIAFIKGTDTNIDANLRFEIYKKVLSEYNIPYDENLVVHGTFQANSGKKAVEIFLDDRKVYFEAIVASNDYMAINAMEELKRRGINIPEDKVVVGFDDVIEARCLLKPLTTVNQPTFEIGFQAAKMLLSIIKMQSIENNIILPSKMIIRKSCGCDIHQDSIIKNIMNQKNKPEFDIEDIKKNIITEFIYFIDKKIKEHFNNNLKINWANQLLNSLLEDIEAGQEYSFLSILEKILNESIDNKVDIYIWYSIIYFLFEKIYSYITSKDKINFIDLLYKLSEKTIENIDIRMQGYLMTINYEQIMQLDLSSQGLLTVFKLSKLNEILIEELPKLGIKSCYLALYDRDTSNEFKKYSKLIFAYKNYKLLNITEEKYLSKKLIPEGIKNNEKNKIFIIKSLYFMDDQLGFVVFEVDYSQIGIYEILTIHLSNALKGVSLYQKIQKQAKTLKSDNLKREVSDNKYEKSSLPKDKSEEYFRKLLNYMEMRKAYKNPDLTLSNLADQLNISRHNLSYVINEYAGLNFYEFINTYRVIESKRFLLKSSDKKINILKIAYDSGFKSKSTFNKIFKKYSSMTPSEFRKKNNIK